MNREILLAIINSDRSDLKTLARIAGGDPRSFFRGTDFSGADLRGEDLTGLDLTGSSFKNANFDHSTRIDEQFEHLLSQLSEEDEASALSRPAWADAFGRDRFGFWASFTLRDPDGQLLTQRLRWIRPGRFSMGSPEDEPGRYENEGPLHEVTIASGFWLFDTPVTQALWETVMGDNPSRFKDKQRPVEEVSFEDVRRFLARANETDWGKGLVLPSDAQWEYACRAGTETATYAGPIEILGDHNAPVLDPIAWYGGNSGVDFDLKNGGDSSYWPDKQYPHTRAGTRKVAQKAPNPWGLYDMLGNVWEWCEDGYRGSHEGAPADGTARVDVLAAGRVVRGGSWHGFARYVRAASRGRFAPDYRDSLGFRCARVQA
jgi:formylglycine-generating enzyme required for sulfatase activity